MNSNVKTFTYNRDKVKAGILHFGIGNFHRAHLEYLTNLLLQDNPDQNRWGICGAMILPQDERLYTALKHQKGEYTLTVCGRDGKDQTWIIGSLVELYWGMNNQEAILNKIACPDIKIITMTITEGGYNQEKSTGRFMLEDEKVKHDLEDPRHPLTAFGYVAEGLRRRRNANAGKITILSCDNLQHNGDTARKSFSDFIEAQDKELFSWLKENVTFPNSMVDRITPATKPEDIKRINEMNDTHDEAPVYTEDFIQWVVEDKFAAGRPNWEKVGVEFTDDVTAYENMKLSLLNASHTLLSYPSFLSGYRKVDAAMHDKRIVKFVRDFMEIDITPYVPAPGDTDLDVYKQTLIERFANRTVSDQVARLCSDGISKFPVYVMPNLIKMIADKKDLTRVAYLIAAYRHYLKFHKDDNGEKFDIAEPWMTSDDKELIVEDAPILFLHLSPFKSTDLTKSDRFTKLYMKFVEEIKNYGAMKTLETII
jgi:mannitol 2-dehydrogenase